MQQLIVIKEDCEHSSYLFENTSAYQRFNPLWLFFRYELSDGQIRSEEGAYKDSVDVDGNPVKVLVVQGAYSWVANGKTRRIQSFDS
jgi:hypothetical protein